MTASTDKYEMVTGEWLKNGANLHLPVDLPWPRRLNWNGSVFNSTAESGINVFVLMHESKKQGYASPFWLTLREGESAGARLKENEKGVSVAGWRWRSVDENFEGDVAQKIVTNVENAISAEDTESQKAVALRPTVVFNAQQWENLPELPSLIYTVPSKEEALETAKSMEQTQAPCEIRHEPTQKAYYNPSMNYIQISDMESYDSPQKYYWDLFEQFGHALAGKHQMNLWEGSQMKELSNDMAFRLLYARMVAAMLVYESGIDVL